MLAIEEAFTNAIRHSGSEAAIEVFLAVETDHLEATVADRGRGFDIESFDPDRLPDPLLDHGRGLFLISRLCDELELRRDGGLEVRLVKRATRARDAAEASFERGLLPDGNELASARRRRTMLDEIDEGFEALDWEYRYVYVNAVSVRRLGMALEDLLGRTPWEVLPALEGSVLQERYREAMELGRPSVIEHRSIVDGQWLEARIYPTTVGVSCYYRGIDERKATVEALRASERLLRLAQDAAGFGVCDYDLVANTAVWDKRLREIMGVASEEPITRDALLAGVHPDDLSLAQAAFARAVDPEGDGLYSVTHRVLRASDGEERWVRATGQASFVDGVATRLTGTVEDITAQRRSAQEEQNRNETFAALLAHMSDGVLMLDRRWRYTFVNNRTLELTGKRIEELVGRVIWEVFPAIRGTDFESALREAMEQRRSLTVEVPSIVRSGWHEVGIHPAANGLALFYHDITERKRAEEALRQSEERFRSLFESTTEGIALHEVIYDDGRAVDYRVVDVNPSFELQTGMAAQDVRGRLASEVYGTGEAPYLSQYAAVAEGGAPACFETYFAPIERMFRITATSPIRGSFATIFEDITERKRVDEERQRMLEESQAQTEELQTQSEELRVQGDELEAQYDVQLAQRAVLLRENELRAGLNTIGQLLHSTLEPGEVMRRALEEAARALAIDAAAIELRESGTWPVRYAEGLPAEALGSALIGEPVIARLVSSSGEALALDDVSDNDTVGPFAARHGIRSLMAVPLVVREEIVGVLLLVERRTIRHFEPAEVDFARRLGTAIGLALENARLFSDVLEASGHLGNVLQSMADGFVSVDHEWRYTLVNPQAERLIGRSAGELLGRSMEELFPDMEGWPHYRRAMADRTAETFEVWSKPLETWLEVHAYPALDGLSILFSDITTRKAAAEELRLHNADLAERAHFADSLNAINRLLHATLDFDTIMQGALDEGTEALGAGAGLVQMREQSQWVVRYQHGLAEADVGRRLSAAEAPIATRVEARGEPLAIADAQADDVVDIEFLRMHTLRSLLAVPLVARAAVIGCLVFYSTTMRVFSDAEIDFARKLGATVSLALENARLYVEQQRIAQTLQENFLHELPEVPGLELGVVSRTANEPELVGGDFSDVFVVDDTHVVALIGDVAGKGVRAAGLTETVRSTVRALAVSDSSPASILAKANELLLRFDPDEPHVTAFLAVLDPHTGHLTYASAGHPAPLHLGPFTARPLEVAFGPPLGSFERPYANAHAMLALDDYLVLYTDGVTEARRGREMYGEARLIEAVASLRGLSAREVAEGVLQDVGTYADKLADDIQIVALRLA